MFGHIKALFWLCLQQLCFIMTEMAQIFTKKRHACKIENILQCLFFGTILGPYLGHIRAMFGLFVQTLCLWMPEIVQMFTEESCIPNRRIPFNVQLLGPYFGHVWAILGPCFGYFYIIFASICLKWLNFSPKSHTCQLETTF